MLITVVLLLALASCHRAPNAQETFDHARLTFVHGDLFHSQEEAERGYRRFSGSNRQWALRFEILEAESLLWRGMSGQVLEVLSRQQIAPNEGDLTIIIPILTLKGVAHAHLHDFTQASEALAQARVLCVRSEEPVCGEVIRADGVLAIERGQFAEAQQYFAKTLSFARSRGDRFLEATALLNSSAASLGESHFDDAIDSSDSSYRIASMLQAGEVVQSALGNLGWAYYQLGDEEKALEAFNKAAVGAVELGDEVNRVRWLTAAAYVYLDRKDYPTAEQSYSQALALAQKIESKEDILNAFMSLGLVYERTGKFTEAAEYSDRAIAMARADGNRLDELYPLLVKGQVAAQLHDSAKATAIFREVARDPQSDPSLKWEAEHSLARLDEDIGQRDSAGREYEAALCTFETARSELHHEESKLPFFTNASRIYDDYMRFLVASGKSDRALQVADFSRARTLAEGLGLLKKGSECAPPLVNPQAVRAKVGASILYYWLGEKQSYLWAITTRSVQLFPLPPAAEIDAAVRRYRKAVEDGEDVLATSNPDGMSLYRTLIAPAAPLLSKGTRVVIIPDGSLNSLNFETLLVPGNTAPHYWIEDAVLTNAHSLRLLSLAKATSAAKTSKALLIGDPLAHNPEYPALPNAKLEMQDIEKHFAPADLTVYMQSSATPSAFLTSRPEQFSYIHFVAHAVASSQVPLDSAVILSPQESKDSFKLYARDIIQHSLRARLVTVSACYGAGTRSYNGEGLIGLSWAFLRAGARNTIGALWEVNDASTPQLMDHFYAELQKGRSPDVALRTAKLSLIQSGKILKKPFYWAPFQLYGTS